MDIQICVCGAGTMGSGIAQVCAQSGFSVKLFDVSENALQHAKQLILKNLDYLVHKNKITQEEKNKIFSGILFTDQIENCTAFLIIEAIAEVKEAKIELFNKLSAFNNEEVIFATNTSSLSITDIQKEIPFPERVAGMHFFNPAYIMPLVEIIKGKSTRKEIIDIMVTLCQQMKKHAVICLDSPGFIVNRVARPYYLESLRLLENGVADFEEIDEILESTGFKMGPFRLMDLIGMDINLATSKSVYQALGNPKRLEPSSIQIQKVTEGKLGKKAGSGFYQY